MRNPVHEFEKALRGSRVAKEFSTNEAKAQYLRDHPDAEPSKHWVKGEKSKAEVSKDKYKRDTALINRKIDKGEADARKKDEQSKKRNEKRDRDDAADNKRIEKERAWAKKDEDFKGKKKTTPVSAEKLAPLKDMKGLSMNVSTTDTLKKLHKGLADGEVSKAEWKEGIDRLKSEVEGSDKGSDAHKKLKKMLSVLQSDEVREAVGGSSKKTAAEVFENALLAEKIAARYAMEHDSPEALKKYLKEHPDADRSNHHVKTKDDGGGETDTGRWDLPQDLSKLTKAQSKKVINFLAKKPLKELRRRQDLTDKQIQKAHADKNTRALVNLQEMRKHLDAAVDQREFGGK